MGATNSTYIGIYLEIPHYKEERIEKIWRNPESGKKVNYKFNPETGLESIRDEITHIDWVEPNSYIEKEGFREDMFFEPAYTGGGKRVCTFISNGGKFRLDNDSDIFNFNISNIDIPKLIAEFKDELKKYLDYYTETYGEYEVKFGIVNNAH